MKNYRGKLVGMKRLSSWPPSSRRRRGCRSSSMRTPQRKARLRHGARADGQGLRRDDEPRAVRAGARQRSTASRRCRAPRHHGLRGGPRAAKPSAERPHRDGQVRRNGGRRGASRTSTSRPRGCSSKILTLAAALPRDQRIAPVDERLQRRLSEPNIDAVRGRGVRGDDVEDRRGLRGGTRARAGEALARPERSVHRPGQGPRAAARSSCATRGSAATRSCRSSRRCSSTSSSSTSRRTSCPTRTARCASPTAASAATRRPTPSSTRPISTLTGVMREDDGDEYPYATPQAVRELYKAKDFGRYRAPEAERRAGGASSTTPTRRAATRAAR